MNLVEAAAILRPFWQRPRPASGPATHDYTAVRGAGHDYTFTPLKGGLFGEAMGWGNGIQKGDILLLRNPKNPDGKAAYRVEEIKYFSDPPDMWSAKLSFVPRTRTAESP